MKPSGKQSTLTRKRKEAPESTKQERCDLLVTTVDKHKIIFKKLETILRLMENDQVATEQVMLSITSIIYLYFPFQ